MTRPSPVLSHHVKYTGADLAATCSLRELYAGMAMQGLLAGSHGVSDCTLDETAGDAVRYADALIAALAGGEDEP